MKLICLHGWSYQTDKWQPLIKKMKSANIDADVLKIPGLTAPEPDSAWCLENYVQWLNGCLKKEPKEIVLLGHSNGGRLATAYAAKYPNRLRKLVLIDSAGVVDQRLRAKLKRSLFFVLAKGGKLFTRNTFLKNLIYRIARENDYNQASPVMKKTMRNLISYDVRGILNKITIPTLIIWGKNDNMTPIFKAHSMHKLISGSELKIIPNAGHSPHFTDSEEVTKLIADFIKTD